MEIEGRLPAPNARSSEATSPVFSPKTSETNRRRARSAETARKHFQRQTQITPKNVITTPRRWMAVLTEEVEIYLHLLKSPKSPRLQPAKIPRLAVSEEGAERGVFCHRSAETTGLCSRRLRGGLGRVGSAWSLRDSRRRGRRRRQVFRRERRALLSERTPQTALLLCARRSARGGSPSILTKRSAACASSSTAIAKTRAASSSETASAPCASRRAAFLRRPDRRSSRLSDSSKQRAETSMPFNRLSPAESLQRRLTQQTNPNA